ncbi:MAG: hypothetical protein IKC83_03840 [Clostridia bacterium]|nr:hypothetical protein [Clostridia bacterium]
MVTENNTVLKISAGKTSEPIKVELIATKKVKEVEIKVFDGDFVASREKFSTNVSNPILSVFVDNAKAWSIEKPFLYKLNVKVNYEDGEREEITDRFGFRYLYSDEKYIYLNGYPFYMRAYIRGAAAHEHQNNCNLSEYDFYKKNIQMAKSYGYNAIRFHSVVPPDTCFEAADDLGILIHIEMRKEGKEYNNLIEMLYGKDTFVSDEEIDKYIKRLYNHPSLAVYCVGNEIRQPAHKPRIRAIRDYIKSCDPTRLFIDTCAHGEYDRDYVDFDVQHMGYFFPYAKNADMFENTDNLLCFGTVKPRDMVINGEFGTKIRRGINFKRPVIAHEVCHYVSWRDYYALREKFQKYGKPAPWWVDEEIKMLEAKGYKENFAETLQITKDYQFRCWKTALENLRSSPLLSGFHMLQFADTDKYENSNGVVDCFDDPHGISPEEFRKFNADCVLLARLQKQIYNSDEEVKLPVLMSQFSINPPESGEFTYTVSDGDNVLYTGTMHDCDTAISGLSKFCSLEFRMPNVTKPTKLTLSVYLDFVDGTSTSNSWEMWVFPKVDLPLSIDAKIDMKEDYIKKVVHENADSNLTITDKLDDKLFERLEKGENVLLIYRTDWTRHLLHKGMSAPEYSFVHTWERYKGVIWDRGTINGGKDDKEMLEKYGFVTDGQINFQYYHLIEDSDKINLDDFPVKVHSMVSGLDKANRDRYDPKKFGLPELMYDRTMRRFSYCFDLKVGKGKLLVTGFNFTDIANNPAVCAMLKTLVNFAHSSDFAKIGEMTVYRLQNYLKEVAKRGPQKERMLTQYWQLDEEPVESREYWQEAEKYLREDS